MLEESGVVVEAAPGFAWIETQRQTACSGCIARTGCGGGALADVLGRRRTRVRAVNRIGAIVGERVVIGLRESALVSGSLLIYLVPLLALIGGATLATLALSGRDAVAAAGAGAGFVLSLFWLRWFGNRIRRDSRYQPVILKRHSDVSVINLPVEALNPPGRM